MNPTEREKLAEEHAGYRVSLTNPLRYESFLAGYDAGYAKALEDTEKACEKVTETHMPMFYSEEELADMNPKEWLSTKCADAIRALRGAK